MGGRLVQLDDAAQVFRAPASEEVARFVGVESILDGRVVEWTRDLALVDVGGQIIEVAQLAEPGERVRLCVRPEDVTLIRASATARSDAGVQPRGRHGAQARAERSACSCDH